MSENYTKKSGICKGCGKTYELPTCVDNCKKRKCKDFSGGYCYGVIPKDCMYGVNGSHEIYFTNDYAY